MKRNDLREQYLGLYADIESILFNLDPVGINFGSNTDEYDPEVDTILPRLKPYHQIDDVRLIIYEEFSRWFDEDAGRIDDGIYKLAAEKIWQAWTRFRNRNLKL